VDGNGILSAAELKALVREYLENGREESKREIYRLLIYKFKFELNSMCSWIMTAWAIS